MTMTPRISVEREGARATIWLDRTDKRNAMDAAMMKELAAALDTIGADKSVHVVLLRGRGSVFSSGIDQTLLAGVAGQTQQTPWLHLHHELQDVFHRIARLHQPVIAALHGVCVGMALELALACDLRIASDDCALGLPEIAFGLVPDVGGTTRLVRAVGEPRARELVLTGRIVRAATAERYGLVHEVAGDHDALARRVVEIADMMAQHSSTALGLAKTAVSAAAHPASPTSYPLEGVVQQVLMSQPDLLTRFPQALAFIKAQVAGAR